MPTVYFSSSYYRGGLGDFVCGALSLYAFCREQHFQFGGIYVGAHPLSECFNTLKVKPQTARHMLIDATEQLNQMVPRARQILLRELKGRPFKELLVTTNAGTFTNDETRDTYLDDFAHNVLVPSQAVTMRIGDLYRQLRLMPRTYISLHVRCGDMFMGAADCYCPTDRRIGPEEAAQKILKLLPALKTGGLPIILHTDSPQLRALLRGTDLHILETHIQHTAQHSPTNSAEDYYDTVAEFFIVGQAAKILYLTWSGFGYWAAKLHNTVYEKIE
jgi:hypothetical protein